MANNKVLSVCAASMAVLIAAGSMASVAAAASAPVAVTDNIVPETTENAVYDLLSEDGDYHVLSAHEITIVNGDETAKIVTVGCSVAKALTIAGVSLEENQITYPPLGTKLLSDCEIQILDAKPVKLTADGETKEVLLPYGIVEESLKLGGIALSKDDILNVKRTDSMNKIDEITIQRVTYKEETVSEKVPFDKVNESDDELELGETKVKTEGVDGEKAVVKRVKYIDGERDSSETIAEKVVKKPVDEVTLVGTKGANASGGAGTFTDENGTKVSYKYKITGSGTAYTAAPGALTASGAAVYEGGVAVNPGAIPLGSKVYVESTDGSMVYGYAKAIDTGGALFDGSAVVDVFYFSYDACVNWGRRDVNVYVIE